MRKVFAIKLKLQLGDCLKMSQIGCMAYPVRLSNICSNFLNLVIKVFTSEEWLTKVVMCSAAWQGAVFSLVFTTIHHT